MTYPAILPQPAPQMVTTVVVDAGAIANTSPQAALSPEALVSPQRQPSITTPLSGRLLAQTEPTAPTPEFVNPADAENLAPLLESVDPSLGESNSLDSNSPSREPSPSFTELPTFSSPSITEPLINFDALPREQNVIPIAAPATPSELVDPSAPAFDFSDSSTSNSEPADPNAENIDGASPATANTGTPAAPVPDLTGIIDLKADNQNFDQQRQVISAEGNVLMRFQGGILSGDRLQINLLSRVVVVNGNAAFVRGQQRLRGERIEYNITQDSGQVTQASGEVFTPSSGTDLLLSQPGLPNAASQESDRITQSRPLTNISNPGQITITTGFGTNFGPRSDDVANSDNPIDAIQIPISISTFRQEGQVNRWRFESDDLTLVPGGFDANDVRLTNDPFSPPQFELRAKKIEVRSVSPLVDELLATRPRFVFEDKISIPTFRRRILLDRRPRDDGLVTFGFDGGDRGGLFIERSFEPISTEKFRFNVTPQFFLQRSLFDSDGFLEPANFGLRAGLAAQITPQTYLTGSARFNTLDPENLSENTRGRVNLSQNIPLGHTLDLNYGYRNRIFNGSLGFRTVRQNFGAVVRSPNIPIGKTGIVVNYQGGLQSITSETDRLDLLEPIRDNNRITLTRYQVGASVSRGFSLWRGQVVPATAEEGLRFSPRLVQPNAGLSVGITGLFSGYSNGDTQDSITTNLTFSGQLGTFSKNWLDYTGWNLTYSQAVRGEQSPFTFDRVEDTRVLAFGLRQQLYGPIRVGLQSSISLQTGERFSTDYFVEYSRRAYGVELRYNPVLELGAVTLRISDFNWLGGTNPFREINTDIQP